ncbi:hypothetical protein [Nakamurella sp.]|uniref:hypothetical protein n=1 Tax=Nakamurella sp. TaxID=1869182 RepID=UPI003B3AEA4E
MDRRLAGALLVLLTVVGATVLSSVAGRGLAGTPVAAPLPDPPAVGDCLLGPTVGTAAATGPAAIADGRPEPPTFGPCDPAGIDPVAGPVGEVVAVRPMTGPDRTAGPAEAGCRPAALAYAGLRPRGDTFAVPGSPADDPIQWRYSVDVQTTWITQLPAHPGAGSWAACIARPGAAGSGPGRLADAFAGGALPGGYGTCWQSAELSAAVQVVDCREPHVAELIALGRAIGTGPVEPDLVRQSCLDQAALVLRRADPTAGGALSIRVDPERPPGGGAALSPACFVTAADGRVLVGSLVGIGDGPLPFG